MGRPLVIWEGLATWRQSIPEHARGVISLACCQSAALLNPLP